MFIFIDSVPQWFERYNSVPLSSLHVKHLKWLYFVTIQMEIVISTTTTTFTLNGEDKNKKKTWYTVHVLELINSVFYNSTYKSEIKNFYFFDSESFKSII